jgi:hypothetical protein
MTEETKTKKPRGPAKTLAQKLQDERDGLVRKVERAERKAKDADLIANEAGAELSCAKAELAQLDAMIEAGKSAVKA